MTVERVTADHGETVKVVGRDGLEFFVDSRIPSEPSGEVSAWIEALWISTDVAAVAEDLEALGLTKRLTQANGRTIDLAAAEGDVLVHTNDNGPIGATVAVRVSDLDATHKAPSSTQASPTTSSTRPTAAR